MYVPSHFAEPDPASLHAFIREHPLALLVTPDLEASHIPVLLYPDEGPHGTLRCHLARANPHAATLASAPDLLAVFTGPEHYVSPNWYPSKAEGGKVVPTWNYTVVHARGNATAFEDRDTLLAHLRQIVDTHESNISDHPWSIDDAPADYIANLTRAIIGIEIRLTSLTGKMKLSQNRTRPDQIATAAALENLGTSRSSDVAAKMHAILAKCEPPHSR